MKTLIKLKLFLLIFTVVTLQVEAYTTNPQEELLFVSHLEGSQVVPAITTNASGIGTFMLNNNRDTISINMSIIGSSATSAGIYIGSEGSSGTLLIDLTNDLIGNSICTSLTGNVLLDNLSDFLKGNLYLQLSTIDHPNGELRGQILLASDWNIVAELSSDEAVPSNTSSGYGIGSFGLSMDKEQLNFKIICQNLTGAISNVKLYIGDIGNVGTEIENLNAYIDGNVIIGSIPASSDFLNNVFSHNVYLNISTTDYPDGQIRSQLRLNEGLSFEVFADGQQMLPIVNTPAKALGVFRLSPTLDRLYYDVVATGINSSLNYIHFHIGSFGQNYGALQLDFTSSIQGNHVKGFLTGAQISNIAIKRLLRGNLALISHTGNYPNGEIRGQAVKFAHEGYTSKLSGAEVVPTVSTSAYGSGAVSVNQEQNRAYYHWVAGDLSSSATEVQFLNAPSGNEGPMIYDMSTIMLASGSEATAKGVWKSTDAQPFSSSNANLFSEGEVYLNINTSNYPNGELRGQLLPGVNFCSTTTVSIGEAVTEPIHLSIYPNPTNAMITIKTNKLLPNDAFIDIIDISGRTFHPPFDLDREDVRVNLAGLQAGVYFLRLNDGNGFVSQMVIKE